MPSQTVVIHSGAGDRVVESSSSGGYARSRSSRRDQFAGSKSVDVVAAPGDRVYRDESGNVTRVVSGRISSSPATSGTTRIENIGGVPTKITVSQPARDVEGKTAIDRIIERSRSGSGSAKTATAPPIDLAAGPQAQELPSTVTQSVPLPSTVTQSVPLPSTVTQSVPLPSTVTQSVPSPPHVQPRTPQEQFLLETRITPFQLERVQRLASEQSIQQQTPVHKPFLKQWQESFTRESPYSPTPLFGPPEKIREKVEDYIHPKDEYDYERSSFSSKNITGTPFLQTNTITKEHMKVSDLPFILELEGSSLEQKAMLEKSPLKKQMYGAEAFGLGFLSGATSVITDPVGTVKGIGSFFLNPVRSVGEIAREVQREPSTQTGRLVGQFVVLGPFVRSAREASPLRFGKVEVPVEQPLNKLDIARETIAREATTRGGYIGGSSGIEIQMPKGTFRRGVDVDVYFDTPDKASEFAKYSEDFYRKHYENVGLDPNRIKVESSKSGQKVIDTKTNTVLVDVGVRRIAEPTTLVGGIRTRMLESIVRDKEGIVRAEKRNLEKVEKARADIDLIQRGSELLTSTKTIYRGIYFGFKEGAVKPLLGFTETGRLNIGIPDVKEMPSVSTYAGLEYGSGNIARYPDYPLSATILSRPAVLRAAGVGEAGIERIHITQADLAANKRLPDLIRDKFPSKTAVMTEGEVALTLEHLRKSKGQYERVYGSFPMMTEIPPELRREVGDIELQFKNVQQARNWGLADVAMKRSKGIPAELVDENGRLQINVRGKKAIELKYHGGPDDIAGSVGYRYGYSEVRPTVTREGLPVQSFFEQMVRKGGASATWYKSVQQSLGGRINVMEPSHRAKDPVDYYRMQLTAAKTRELLGDISGARAQEARADAYRKNIEKYPYPNRAEILEQFREIDLQRKLGYPLDTRIKFELVDTPTSQRSHFTRPGVVPIDVAVSGLRSSFPSMSRTEQGITIKSLLRREAILPGESQTHLSPKGYEEVYIGRRGRVYYELPSPRKRVSPGYPSIPYPLPKFSYGESPSQGYPYSVSPSPKYKKPSRSTQPSSTSSIPPSIVISPSPLPSLSILPPYPSPSPSPSPSPQPSPSSSLSPRSPTLTIVKSVGALPVYVGGGDISSFVRRRKLSRSVWGYTVKNMLRNIAREYLSRKARTNIARRDIKVTASYQPKVKTMLGVRKK